MVAQVRMVIMELDPSISSFILTFSAHTMYRYCSAHSGKNR